MVLRGDGLSGLVFILLIFPVIYVVRLLILLSRAITVDVMYSSGGAISQTLTVYAQNYVKVVAPVSLSMAIFVFLWPMIAGYWQWLFCRMRGKRSWADYQGYIVGANLTGAAAILILL